jgi:hypothetical protein
MRLSDQQILAVREACISIVARISRLMHERKVDVLLSAPNLQHFPIHEVALKEGVLL